MDQRARDMCERRAKGETLDSIGASYGVTRERVRQIIAKAGGPDKQAAAAAQKRTEELRKDKLRKRALEFISQNPGSSRDQLAEFLQVDADSLRQFLKQRDLQRLVVVPKAQHAKMSEGQIFRGLRRVAAELGEPLSHDKYDLVRRPDLGEASSVRIMQIYGTWNAACKKAGLKINAKDRVYKRNWNEEQVLGWVADYLMSPRNRATYAGYEEWARTQTDAPSGPTVRNRIGPWSSVKKAALIVVEGRRKSPKYAEYFSRPTTSERP